MAFDDDGYSVTDEPIPFDPAEVFPMVNNPNTKALARRSPAFIASQEFNQSYAQLLNTLHEVFNGHPDRLATAITQMDSLKVQAQALMQLPLEPGLPLTVGPSFEYPNK